MCLCLFRRGWRPVCEGRKTGQVFDRPVMAFADSIRQIKRFPTDKKTAGFQGRNRQGRFDPGKRKKTRLVCKRQGDVEGDPENREGRICRLE